MDFRHLIVTCLFSMLRLSFENQKNKKNYAIFLENLGIFLMKQQVIFTSTSFNIKIIFNLYGDLACKNPKQIQVYH